MSAPARGPLRAAFVLHLHGLERAAEGAAADNYPPYDLLRVEGGLRLVFAVAGFGPDQLEITVIGDQLLINGEGAGEADAARFLHRGIAARRFRRAFRLAPGLDVADAELDRGLLTIALDLCPQGRPARTIPIGPRRP